MAKLRPLERLLQKFTCFSSIPTSLHSIPDDSQTTILLILLALSPSNLGSKTPTTISQQALRLATSKKKSSNQAPSPFTNVKDEINISPHIRALLTLLGRILRRLWKLPISAIIQLDTSNLPLDGKKERTYMDRLLRVVQDDLAQLANFLAEYCV